MKVNQVREKWKMQEKGKCKKKEKGRRKGSFSRKIIYIIAQYTRGIQAR